MAELPSVDGLVLIPSMPQPQTRVVTDTQVNRFHYQETAPQSGTYWVFPMQISD